MATLPSLPTVDQIAAGYAAITRSDAGARWRWARQILAIRAAEKSDKDRATMDKELGIRCAAAVNRATPYSPQWVRAFVNAAKKFASEPQTPEDCAKFLAVCNGNQSKPAKSGGESTKDDALRMLKSAAKLALKRGATDDEIAQAIEDILSAPGAQAA